MNNLEHFRCGLYRFSIEMEEEVCLPPYKGSAFRGGFGQVFKKIACALPGQCQERCQIGHACPYGYVFETAPPADAERLRTLSDVPRPFVLRPPRTRQEVFAPGERLNFDLMLAGRGIEYLPYFLIVFRTLGEEGIGRGRGRYRLRQVVARHPPTGEEEAVYRGEDGLVRNAGLEIRGEALGRAAPLQRECQVEFLTPTRLRSEGALQDKPEFVLLYRAALRRISALLYFHCGVELDLDFRAEIEAAGKVRCAEDRTRWEDWERYSSRQGQRMKLGGIVGAARYEGELERFGAVLRVAELVHVGKNCTFGLGEIRVTQGEGPTEKKDDVRKKPDIN